MSKAGADRERADQGGHRVAAGRDLAIRRDHVPGVEHSILGNSLQQPVRGLNRLEPDSPPDVNRADPPGERTADPAVAVIQEDVRRARHGLGEN